MSLKNAVEHELHVPVRLRAGAPGSLTVFIDGEQVFSRKQTGRSPTAAELIELIRGQAPAAGLPLHRFER